MFASTVDNSCPWRCQFSLNYSSPEASAVCYQQTCVSLQHKIPLSQHGTQDMTVLQVLFWHEAMLPISLLGSLINVQVLLWGTGGRWRAGQTANLQVHNSNSKWRQGSDVMRGVWGKEKKVSFGVELVPQLLQLNTLSEWAGGWWIWQERWRASVSL